MATSYSTLTYTTASVNPGSSTQRNDAIITNVVDIIKIKVTPSNIGAGELTVVEIFNSSSFATGALCYATNNFTGNLVDPIWNDGITPTEKNEGFVAKYQDLDATSELHLKITNNGSLAKTYTVTITYATNTFNESFLSIGPTTSISGNSTAFHTLAWNWLYTKNPTIVGGGFTNTFSGVEDNSVGAGKVIYGASLYSEFTGTSSSLSKIQIGAGLQCSSSGSGALGGAYGLDSEAVMETGCGNVGALLGGYFRVKNNSSSTADIAAAIYIDTSQNSGGGTLANPFAIKSLCTDPTYLAGNLQVGPAVTPFGHIFFAGDGDSAGGGLTMCMSGSGGILGAEFIGRKSNGTNASPTDVASGDVLFGLVSNAYSGSGYLSTANISFSVSGSFTTGQRPPTQITFRTGPANTLVGNSMILTSDPFLNLVTSYSGGNLSAAGTVALRNNAGTLETSQNGGAWASISGGGGSVTSATMTANGLVYATGASAIASIAPLTNGQLLIGSTGSTPVGATITNLGGLTISNGAGSISMGLTSLTADHVLLGLGVPGYQSSPNFLFNTSTNNLVVGLSSTDNFATSPSIFAKGQLASITATSNASIGALTAVAGTAIFLSSGKTGTGTYLPLSFSTGGATNMSLGTTGALTLAAYGSAGGLVSIGIADSGGTGFRLLRVPN